jgi:hypothetical protein
MKRLLLIGTAASVFALAPILSASAMPGATPNALIGTDTSIIQVHGWGHQAWVITMDGVEVITMDGAIITIGETQG